MKKLIMASVVVLTSVVCFGATPKGSYVYKDGGSREHMGFIPSGWMGSFRSLKMNPNWTQEPHSAPTCIRIEYNVNKDTETAWAGIYWQTPANNWGDKKGGYDLTGYKRLSFWARGTGYIGTFGFGGINGTIELGDLDEARIEAVDLTPEWKEYVIDLKGLDLSHVIGGFYFSTSAEYNSKNVVLMLDDIHYEK